MSDDQLFIEELVVHILDGSLGVPIVSDESHPQSAEISDFIKKHITRILKDPSLKKSEFTNDSNSIKNVCKVLQNKEINFLDATKQIAITLYELISKHPDIPSADLVCSIFKLNNISYLGIIKFNYRPSYIHYVGEGDKGKVNSIIKQKTCLPNENQKVDEGFFINLNDLSIKLIEKAYLIDDKKQHYLSSLFLECTSELSGKEKVKILEKVTENCINKYYGESNVDKRATFKRIINENIEDQMKVDIEEIAETVFGNIPEIKDTYIEEVNKKGIKEKEFVVNYDRNKNLYKKQKIVTDSGIEINVPIVDVNNKDKVEFLNNADGTISILLKNIKKIN
jgi:hypothetical protein